MARSLEFYRGRPVVTEIMGLSKVRRMPRIGKIHLGIKVPSSKNAECRKKNHPDQEMCLYCSYPKDCDYFVFPKDLDGRLAAKIKEVYGEKPTALDIYFPTNHREQFFPQGLMWYQASRLICKGDGQSALRVDPESGKTMQTRECPCEHFTREEKPDCKYSGRLMVLLPRITMAGIWQIDTGSANNIIDINSACDYYASLLQRLAFVPFTLKRVPTKINDPTGKMITKHLLRLEFEGDEAQVAAFRERDAISALGPAAKALVGKVPPAPDLSEAEEEEEAMTIDGKVLTPPDQLPPNVDPKTGEVLEEPPQGSAGAGEKKTREPGADENEDGLEEPAGAAPAGPTEKPPDHYTKIPPYIKRAETKADCTARWLAAQPLLEGKVPAIRTAQEDVYKKHLNTLAK